MCALEFEHLLLQVNEIHTENRNVALNMNTKKTKAVSSMSYLIINV